MKQQIDADLDLTTLRRLPIVGNPDKLSRGLGFVMYYLNLRRAKPQL
ncbi:hypothetical protein [Congregibacter sp.]